jgi:hypothetical protein
MATTNKDRVSIGEIKEEYAILSESPSSDWTTELCRISWKGKESKVEIRKLNKKDESGEIIFGKGIALTTDELNILTEELIKLGYGNRRAIKNILKEESVSTK